MMVQYFLRKFKPVLNGFLTKVIYHGRNVSIGKNFRCDSVPRILIDKTATLIIRDNVELRRNVELRVHQDAKLSIGDSVRIDRGVRILAANKASIEIADKVRIGLYTVLNGGDSIIIGEASLISGFVYLQTSMHGFKDKNIILQNQGFNHAPVVLEEDVWIGTHAVILPGVILGRGVVVGSNAVVTKTVKEYTIVGGVPAMPIKERE